MPKPDVSKAIPKEEAHADATSKTIPIEDGSITDVPKESAEQVNKDGLEENDK